MKKIVAILVVAVSFMMVMPAHAQLKFGVKGGLNLAKADFDKSDLKTDNFTGFFIGPMAELTLPIIGLGVDGALLFSQKGVKYAGEKVKETGLEIPVNLKYSIGLGSLASIYFAAGPGFFIDFSKNEMIDNTLIKKKQTQLALNLGFGVKLLKHLQIGANYNMPLTESAEFNFGDLIDKDSYKTKVWQVSVAYIF